MAEQQTTGNCGTLESRLLTAASSSQSHGHQPIAPLLHKQATFAIEFRSSIGNPRYFTDGSKNADGSRKAVYLTGSHTWGNLCDYRAKWPAFDYSAYLPRSSGTRRTP